MEIPTPDAARYARHLALPEIGVAGQQKLAAASVLIMGAGGLGSPSGLYLAAAGVGHIGLLDDDHIEVSNLQRQVMFSTGDIGQGKAETARARLLALNPGIRVTAHSERLVAGNAERLFAPYDIVIDGTEEQKGRWLPRLASGETISLNTTSGSKGMVCKNKSFSNLALCRFPLS